MSLSPWTVPLIAATLTLAGERIACSPEVGQTVLRTFSHVEEMALEDMTLLMNGEENPMMGGMEMEEESSSSRTWSVRDAVLEVEQGRASALERTYVELAGESSMFMLDPMGEEHGGDSELHSDLEGRTVLFTGDAEDFKAEWGEDSDGDAGLLEGLGMSMDLELLLPEDAVEPGDSWSVSLELLELLSAPGGELGLKPENALERLDGAPSEEPDEELSGSIEATFAEVREVDGRRLALVELEVDVEQFTDLTDSVTIGGPDGDEELPEGMVVPDVESMIQERLTTGSGSFLWDLQGGRLHSLELSCDVEESQEMVMFMSMGPEEVEMSQLSVRAGTTTWEVTCEG